MAFNDKSKIKMNKSVVSFRKLGYLGELGNSLFQISATIGYAEKHNKVAKFPKWTCKISGNDYSNILKNNINQNLDEQDLMKHYVCEYNELLYIDIPECEFNLDLSGYFQSEKYFEHCKDLIRETFLPNDEIERNIRNKWPDVINDVSNKVCVHMRTALRASNDYDVHQGCTKDYMEKVLEHYGKDKEYIIFSDNFDAAVHMIPDEMNTMFITGNKNYEDLFMMNYFNKYALSPSTFGWWGAYLSKFENPEVIIMKNWFNPLKEKAHMNNNSITPKEWKTIE